MPLPNIGGNTYSFNPVTTQHINQYLTRLDFTVRPSDTIWGSWFIQPQTQQETIPFTPGFSSNVPGFAQQDTQRTQQYALTWTPPSAVAW